MKQLLQTLFNRKVAKNGQPESIVIVTGLPRSGTSMMMKMLEAGGLPILTDNLREADIDNPKGYYEFERVKQLNKGDHAWLNDAQGKVVKVISALLEHLPSNYTYKVIFMHRQMEEILASQKKMLVHREESTDKVSDEELTALFEKHKTKVIGWLRTQPNISLLEIHYNKLLQEPQPHLHQINQFLANSLNLQSMGPVIDANLYREKKVASKMLLALSRLNAVWQSTSHNFIKGKFKKCARY
jgi:hypothetical protein